MSSRVRVLKRSGQWHWWCPDCMGGDWGPTWADAMHLATRHTRDRHAYTKSESE